MFNLADIIAKHPKEYTATKLAEMYGVSARTIHRDIGKLEDAGVRVEHEESGGYFIMRDLSRLPIAFTTQERLAMEIFPWLIKGAGGNESLSSLTEAYISAMGKVSDKLGLSLNLNQETSRLGRRIITDFGMHQGNSQKAESNIHMLFHAMNEQITIDMEYYSFSSAQVSKRMLDPYCIIPKNNSFYVIGFCHRRLEYRTFKVSRIKSIELTNHRFVYESDFSSTNCCLRRGE